MPVHHFVAASSASQADRFAIAKAEGKYNGRKPSLNVDQVRQIRERASSGEKKTSLAREFGVSRKTIYPYLAQAA